MTDPLAERIYRFLTSSDRPESFRTQYDHALYSRLLAAEVRAFLAERVTVESMFAAFKPEAEALVHQKILPSSECSTLVSAFARIAAATSLALPRREAGG